MTSQSTNVQDTIQINSTQVTESVDRLVNHLSINNIQPPRFDIFKDVHDFLVQFEKITLALDDAQKLLVLPKAFPVDCYRSWYETELLPLIKSQPEWSAVKKAIISRFSSSDEQDKHFARLRDLKYDQDSGKSLLSYIEDVIYSYKRAHPNDSVINTVKYVKASVPPAVKSKLNLYVDFKNADSFEMLKSAAKDFDQANSPVLKETKTPEPSQELVKMLQEMITSFKKENDETRKSLILALQSKPTQTSETSPSDQSRPQYSSYRSDRQISPNRSYYGYRPRSPSPGYHDSRFKRESSPGRQDYYQQRYREGTNGPRSDYPRPRSPSPTFNRQNYQSRLDPRPPSLKITDNNTKLSDTIEAFNSQEYYKRFGKPPYPCQHCGGNHFMRHCFNHLN